MIEAQTPTKKNAADGGNCRANSALQDSKSQMSSSQAPRGGKENGGAIDHLPPVDGLRGLAITMVLLLHFGVSANFSLSEFPKLGQALTRVFYVGWAGVDLFFVISGFLITSILLSSRENPSYFKLFYSRRILRISPLYYGTLFLCILLVPLLPAPYSTLGLTNLPRQIGWLLLYLSNIAMAFGSVASFGLLDIYWTLAIEEQFYLVWPLAVKRIRPVHLAVVCGAVILVSPLLRALFVANERHWMFVYRFTLTRLDGLAIGALLAIARHLGGGYWALATRLCNLTLIPLMLVLSAVFIMIYPFYPESHFVLIAGHSLLALFFASLLGAAISGRRPLLQRLFTTKALTRMGRYSYGIYIMHWPLLQFMATGGWVGKIGLKSGLAWSLTYFLSGFTGSVVLGAASYHGFEKHFLKLRRYFVYVPATSAERPSGMESQVVPTALAAQLNEGQDVPFLPEDR